MSNREEGFFLFFFWQGLSVYQVSFVSYLKRNQLISSRQHLKMSRRKRRRRSGWRRGKAILIFTHRRKIAAASFIKEQSLQKGHKLSSEVFTIITISPLPTPPALSSLSPSHSPLFTSEITCHSSALLKSTLACSGTVLSFFHSEPHKGILDSFFFSLVTAAFTSFAGSIHTKTHKPYW